MSLKGVCAVLVVVSVLGVLAWSDASLAENLKVKTNQPAKLHSRAGEQSKVLLTVKEGQSMTVVDQDGRWLQVRVGGRTGWIPRSKVDMPEDDEAIARNTRRRPFVDGRSTKRGFGGDGGPEDRIGADATGEGDEDDGEAAPQARKPARDKDSDKDSEDSDDDDDGGSSSDKGGAKDDGDDEDDEGGQEAARPMARVSRPTEAYNEPSADSDTSFTAKPKMALYVVEEKGKWTAIENDEGELGYVMTKDLEIDEPMASGKRVRIIHARGRLGVALIHQSVSTPGGTALPPDNYGAGSSSLAVALGGSVLYPYSRRFWLGGELAYDYDKAIPGIAYMNSTTSFSYHNLNLRAVGGYDLQKSNGMTVFARLGFHYDSFQVANVADFTKNTARLPSQIISGPTLGAAVDIPKLSNKLGLKISLDALFAGSLSQTKNLEDGTGPGAKGIYLGGMVTYRWKRKMDLQATYDLGYTSISFSGPPPMTSQRGHTGTGNASGSDLNNTLSVGVAYAF